MSHFAASKTCSIYHIALAVVPRPFSRQTNCLRGKSKWPTEPDEPWRRRWSNGTSTQADMPSASPDISLNSTERPLARPRSTEPRCHSDESPSTTRRCWCCTRQIGRGPDRQALVQRQCPHFAAEQPVASLGSHKSFTSRTALLARTRHRRRSSTRPRSAAPASLARNTAGHHRRFRAESPSQTICRCRTSRFLLPTPLRARAHSRRVSSATRRRGRPMKRHCSSPRRRPPQQHPHHGRAARLRL